MTFYANIPQSTDRPSQSQGQILSNFGTLNTIFGIDHITFTEAENRGYHNQLTMQEQAADPAAIGDAGYVYTKDTAGITELYYRYDSSATPNGRIIQLSTIKAWCRFDGTLATPIAITDGINVTNVTKTAPGRFTINFTNSLGNANYAVLVTAGTAANDTYIGLNFAMAVNNCQIVVRDDGGDRVDAPIICVMVIGN